jgi:SepF-like predicted cell division protein (DUF552 family)
MTISGTVLSIDPNGVVHDLEEALQRLQAGNEVVLDFTPVRRIDPGVLPVLEKLAGLAERSNRRLLMQGVNADIYKVLKLTRLAPRFSFLG